MNGFLGMVEADDAAADCMSRWMAEWVTLRPAKAEVSCAAAPFRFMGSAESDSDAERGVADRGALTLVYAGFVAPGQLAGQSGKAPTTSSQVAEALLERYIADGADSLAALNGRYVIAVWDAGRQSLELMNDCLGLKPVFLWQRGESIAFASNVWAIACHPEFCGEIDTRGVVDTLLLSHQQGNRTLHRDVSVLPPGSVTRWTDGRLSQRTVRTLEFSDSRWHWGMDRLADAMHDALAESVRQRIPDSSSIRLPLSGGVDSRTMLGLLCERDVELNAFTQWQPGAYSIDARNAAQLARRAGVGLSRVPLADDFLSRYREKCVAINGGLYDIHTGRYLSLSDQSEMPAYGIVSGHLGGELTGRFQFPDTAFSTVEERYELAFREVNMFRFDADGVRDMLAFETSPELVDESLQECRRFYMDQPGEHFQQGMAWDLLLSRRRFISFQVLYLEQFCRAFAPFYDREFVDLMSSMPFCALEGQRAYLRMVCRHFPDLARVPNSNTGRPMVTSTAFVIKDFLRSQYSRFIRRPVRRLFKLRRWVGNPCLQFGFALMGSSRSVLEHLLANAERLGDCLDVAKVRTAVREHLDGKNEYPMGLLALSALVTAAEMLEDPYLAIRAWQDSGEES